MNTAITLSELVEEIQETILDRFEGELYWVNVQISNVKKYESTRRCYLTLEEFSNGVKTAELRAVFWSNSYQEIDQFERLTKQVFQSGIAITCLLKVRFHKVYGLNADVLKIDVAHALGTLELQRQQTLERLVKENPKIIQLTDGIYRTYNRQLTLPVVVTNIALITAANSDGQRDFVEELLKNKHGYVFALEQFLTIVQGEQASAFILEQLKLIKQSGKVFDAVAIVRGGGSQTDFLPFDDYALAKEIAGFPFPIFTGIGHDRNQSIADLMARELKTPTKVASFFVEHNFEFENNLIRLKQRFDDLVTLQIETAKSNIAHAKRIVKLASPQAILNRGFAIIMKEDQIITNPDLIAKDSVIQIILKNELMTSTVTKKQKHEKRTEL